MCVTFFCNTHVSKSGKIKIIFMCELIIRIIISVSPIMAGVSGSIVERFQFHPVGVAWEGVQEWGVTRWAL